MRPHSHQKENSEYSLVRTLRANTVNAGFHICSLLSSEDQHAALFGQRHLLN